VLGAIDMNKSIIAVILVLILIIFGCTIINVDGENNDVVFSKETAIDYSSEIPIKLGTSKK
jgi:hypothetical protein